MSLPALHATSADIFVLLAFDPSNRLVVQCTEEGPRLPFIAAELSAAEALLKQRLPLHTAPRESFCFEQDGKRYHVYLTQIPDLGGAQDLTRESLERLEHFGQGCPLLKRILKGLEEHLIEIPYLHLGENDFIHRFKPEKDRNSAIYEQDPDASQLYFSRLCEAVKMLARQQERSAGTPVELDFGPVRYVIPSHFGFCLGVKNAIERAYETLATNRDRRVFMLSELIHNPFVNSDLLRRGLRYLQSDKGVPFTTEGRKASGAPGEVLLWDTLGSEDIVIIPAFGATDEDKRRLIRKGIPVCQYDATCMLVEKVWKAARLYGREGYSVIIHGKHEHEETKATFSNTRQHAPALIIRNIEEARLLGEIIADDEPARAQERLEQCFNGRFSEGFDVRRHLERIAVVNQTTLLSNETLGIIDFLKAVYERKFGDATRVGGSTRRDTLCYATQVNQDALGKALDLPLDAAFVIGGKNSSNTYQLFRLCEYKLGTRAFFIQSEEAIRADLKVDHYVFPGKGDGEPGRLETRELGTASAGRPLRILVTGGASCPDGIIHQVILRINSLFPSRELRPLEKIIDGLRQSA